MMVKSYRKKPSNQCDGLLNRVSIVILLNNEKRIILEYTIRKSNRKICHESKELTNRLVKVFCYGG